MADTLVVPNWTFYDPSLALQAEAMLTESGCCVHYCKGDPDHQRTVTAFSGSTHQVVEALLLLCRELLPAIDLTNSHGVHPRVGALDVLPFVSLGASFDVLQSAVEGISSRLWQEFEIPVYLYEQSARPGKERGLPVLRGQVGRYTADPDFGSLSHFKWGTTIVGVRDFLLATNIELAGEYLATSHRLAKEIRQRRENGDAKFAGIRALGFSLASRGTCQLSLNFTQPDVTTFDELFAFVAKEVPILSTELIGVIRRSDLPKCTNLSMDSRQVVD